VDLDYFLRLQPGFDHLSNKQLAVFSSMLDVGIYPAHHVFNTLGVPDFSMHLIMDGSVEITDHAHRHSLGPDRILRVGEWFGILSLAGNLPSFENSVASEKVMVASFNRAHFDDLLEFAPPVGLALLYMLSKQLARTLSAQNKLFNSMPSTD
jgi:CRP-like cAMP-binding protein